MNALDDDYQLIKLNDFARRISVSPRTIYRRIDEGILPKPLKQGRHSYFYESDLADYLTSINKRSRK